MKRQKHSRCFQSGTEINDPWNFWSMMLKIVVMGVGTLKLWSLSDLKINIILTRSPAWTRGEIFITLLWSLNWCIPCLAKPPVAALFCCLRISSMASPSSWVRNLANIWDKSVCFEWAPTPCRYWILEVWSICRRMGLGGKTLTSESWTSHIGASPVIVPCTFSSGSSLLVQDLRKAVNGVQSDLKKTQPRTWDLTTNEWGEAITT